MLNLSGTIALSTAESLLAACLVLIAGALLTRKVRFLAKYNIPDPIVGGLLFAVAVTLLGLGTGLRVSLEVTAKPFFLLLFFPAAIGI